MRSMQIYSTIFKDCITSCDRFKNIFNFPCAHKKFEKYNFKKMKQHYETRSRGNAKFTKASK